MKRRSPAAVHAVLIGLLAVAPLSAAPEMDLIFFVNRLNDLDYLPYFMPGETSKQHSSYDRHSRLGPNGEKIDWGANGDAGQYIRTEPNGEAVMAEMDGPGVVTQTWSANPQGKLHFYIDGAEKPIVFDFAAFTTGGIPEIPAPISTKGGGAGANSYLPIPYAKRCVIKADRAHGQYYHFDYTTYPAGTPVTSFSWPLSQAEKDALAKAAAWWETRCGENPGSPRPGGGEARAQGVVRAGATVPLADLKGPAIVTAFRMKVEGSGRDYRRALLIRAFWDGAEKPSIEAPYGDFFSSTWADVPFKSLPIGMTEKGGYSYWRMPFARGARFEVVNEGSTDMTVSSEISYAPAEWNENAMHFHAKWRREAPNKTFDWPYLKCEGRGRYVGVTMSVQNPDPPWFGEGDEKVYVDGEAFPSWFGTGTEDYFCDAWGFRPFIQPTHGCPMYNEPGKTTVYRWHTLDNIPFSKSFEITIENYGNNKDYSSVAYWYATPPNRDFFAAPKFAERTFWPHKLPGVIEAEDVAKPGAGVEVIADAAQPFELSGGKGLRIGAGQEAVLSIPIGSKDAYRITVLGPKGQSGAGLTVRAGGALVIEAGAPAFGRDGRIAAPRRALVDTGTLELRLKPAGSSVVVDAIRLEPVRREPGALEAESLERRVGPGVSAEIAYALEGDAASGAAYLQISASAPDQPVELAVPPNLAGTYQVTVRILGGEKPADVSLGTVSLPGGAGNKIVLKAGPSPLRIDYLKLKLVVVEDAIEAEGLKILKERDSQAQHQGLGDQWSAGTQLFCPGAQNQFVDLALPVKKAGKYALAIYFTKAADYGIVEVELDGKAIGQKFNGYNDGVIPSGKVDFGTIELAEGAHTLTFRVREKDQRSSNFFMGIDCLTLKAAP